MLLAVELALGVLTSLSIPQELELRGVTVITGTDAAWPARSIAVSDARVTAPGAKTTGPSIDLGGHGFVHPGLVDAHGHLIGLGRSLEEVDLVGTRSYAEVISRVRARAAELPAGSWVLGRGWDQNDWPEARLPSHEQLSSEVPDHPVVLTRVDGHALLANYAAMQAAGIVDPPESPMGGEVVLEAGLPTGVFVDAAMPLVTGAVPSPTEADLERWLLAAQSECLRLGLTGVHDAGLEPGALAVMRRLHTAGQWRLRVYAMLPAAATEAIRAGPWQTPDRIITVRAVKGYADGALGSRGAALLEPYTDRPGWKGLLLTPPKALRSLSQLCADHGFQLCVHAIGDAANRAVLDAYTATEFRSSLRAARYRIEHAQIVHPEDAYRFGELGVIASMQPTHLTSDMPWAPARLGPDRVAHAYAWRSFLDAGQPVPFGSDFPVENVDPLAGFYAAATTRAVAEPGGEPGAELRPEQKLTRAEILRGFTAHAAFASFFERDLGVIAPGRFADFTVYDRDLLTCDDDDLGRARVLLTVVGGEVAYVAPGADRSRTPIAPARVKALLDRLADDEMLGRDTPSRGLDRAAELIAATFGAVGLWPGGDVGTYFHGYTAPGVEVDSDAIEIELQTGREADSLRLVGGRDVRVLRPGRAIDGQSRCRVVDQGDLRRRRAPRQPLLVRCGGDGPLWRSAEGIRSVLTRRLRGTAPILLVRDVLVEPGEFDATIRVPAPVELDVPLRNVVGTLPGTDLADQYVMVTAHYDHVGVRPVSGDDQVFNGTDDDATGTAAVMTIAESLARSGVRLRRTVVFACFSGEEKGLIGSRAFAANPPFALDDIAALVNLEMLGRPPEGGRLQAWVTGADLSDFAAIATPVLAAHGVEVIDFPMASRLFSASDNLPFARAGVVAHSISAGHLHEDYHGPNDEVDRIDVEHMATVVTAIRELVIELANRDGRLAYNDKGLGVIRK